MTVIQNQQSNFAPVGVPGSWEFKFGDEFDGTALDTSKWNDNWLGAPGTITKPVNSAEIGAYDPAQVKVGGGNLQLTAVKQTTTAADGKTYAYKSGLIESANKHEFTEGFFEARIYMPDDGGNELYNWGALWLNGHHNSWPDHGENDIMENLSGGPAWHYHGPAGSSGRTPAMDPKGWHTYAANWEDGKITYYYDGKMVGEVTSGVVDASHYMILNYGISNEHGGPVAGNKTMLVDYVRVWERSAPPPPPADETFVFRTKAEADQVPTITTWNKGDKIDLSAIDAHTRKAGDQAFTWKGTTEGTTKGAELWFWYDSAANLTKVYGSTDGDRDAEFRIEIAGQHALVASNFIL